MKGLSRYKHEYEKLERNVKKVHERLVEKERKKKKKEEQ